MGEAPDIAGLQTLLARLRELLEDDDTDADRPIQALTPLLAGFPQAPLLRELAEQVDAYDFDAALDTLGRLDAECPEAEMSDHTAP